MSIPIDRDNTGSVNINNINNEPMLKIVNKGNGKVDLNSASDKNALSIDANGVVSASDLTATNLTTRNLTTSNLTLLQPNLNIPANTTIGGTTTLNGTLTANSTSYFRNGYLEVYDQNLNLNGESHLNMQTGDLNVGGANSVSGGDLSVNGGNLNLNGGHLNITGPSHGTFSVADPGTGLPSVTTVSNIKVTANSVILITINAYTSGAIAGVYVSSKSANSGFTVNNTDCNGTFDYVIIN